MSILTLAPLYTILFCAPLSISCNTAVASDKLTVSVVIPCIPQHAPFLRGLIEAYAAQTVRPQEVIIALSEVNKVPTALLRKINGPDISWPFKVIIAGTKNPMNVSKNRNHGTQHATGEIIMYQDADDLPHPQRVEIVTYFFKTYDIVHLLHFYIPSEGYWYPQLQAPTTFPRYTNLEEIRREQLTCKEQMIMWQSTTKPVYNGCPCIRRSVWERFKWDETIEIEDIPYNELVLRHFPQQAIIIDAFLAIYRREFSVLHPRSAR